MAKILREDGSTYYYYYTKKRGRHKKTGPKKKKKKPGAKNQDTWDFKILQFDSKKQVAYIGKYHNLGEADAVKQKLLKENDSVEFPVKYVNNGKYRGHNEYVSEYLILKRNTDNINGHFLRNEYGKLTENKITDKDWVVYDKFPHVKEETFWVYGYNPKTDRKTFHFIYDNFINKVIDGTYNLVQVYIYNNKVIFRYDYDQIEFVVCKNTSDAIRMYNLLEEKYKKSKQVFFTGSTTGKDYRAGEIKRLIMEKTGWSIKKIYKKTTSD